MKLAQIVYNIKKIILKVKNSSRVWLHTSSKLLMNCIEEEESIQK